jgi:hypothetical protein
MSEQVLFQFVFSIVMIVTVANTHHISDYIDDCVDSYKKYRKNKQTH